MGSRVIHSKKKAGRIYPQENLKSGRTELNKRIPGIPPRVIPGGQAACKHPKESQVGIQNTRSFTEQRNKKLNNTPTTIGVLLSFLFLCSVNDLVFWIPTWDSPC